MHKWYTPRIVPQSRPVVLFGDALASARERWIREMTTRLAALGFDDYRRSDALALRWLAHGPTPLAALNAKFGVSRQATRKVVDGLVERNYATVQPDPVDARRRIVELSQRGREYAAVVITTVHELNADVTRGVDPERLATALSVLGFVAERFGR